MKKKVTDTSNPMKAGKRTGLLWIICLVVLLACWGRSAYAQSDTIMAHELASWMQEADPYLRSVAYNPTYRDFKLEKGYLHCLDKLMTDAPDIPLAVEMYICKALWLSYSNLVGTKAEAVRVCEEGIRRFPSYSRTEELRRIRDELLCPHFTLRNQADPYPGDTLRLEVRYRMLNAPVQLKVYSTSLQTYTERDACNNDEVFCQSSPKLVYEASHEFPLPPVSNDKQFTAMPGTLTDTVINLPLPPSQASTCWRRHRSPEMEVWTASSSPCPG